MKEVIIVDLLKDKCTSTKSTILNHLTVPEKAGLYLNMDDAGVIHKPSVMFLFAAAVATEVNPLLHLLDPAYMKLWGSGDFPNFQYVPSQVVPLVLSYISFRKILL